jgi:hypothetical protein
MEIQSVFVSFATFCSNFLLFLLLSFDRRIEAVQAASYDRLVAAHYPDAGSGAAFGWHY